MSVNISARAFSLTINGINRTANVINISLSQNELGDSGVFVSGSITLQANYNQVTDFTYLASPSIGANWARGVQVVYRIANDSGFQSLKGFQRFCGFLLYFKRLWQAISFNP